MERKVTEEGDVDAQVFDMESKFLVRQQSIVNYKKSKRPIQKTQSMEKIEEFKSAKLRNVLMTGLNNRLLLNLQEKITESKSQATIASARTVNKGIETIEESSEGGSKNTRNDSKESNALTGS